MEGAMDFMRWLSSMEAIPAQLSAGNAPGSWGPQPTFLKRDLGGHHSVHRSSISEGVRVNHKGWGHLPVKKLETRTKAQVEDGATRRGFPGHEGAKPSSSSVGTSEKASGLFLAPLVCSSPIDYCPETDRPCPGSLAAAAGHV